MLKRSLFVGVLLFVVVGGLIGFNLFRAKAMEGFFANQTMPALTVSTSEAATSVWTPSINAIGTLDAVNGVDLTVETSGVITEMTFSANQKVKKGDVLLRLDDAVQAADLLATSTQADLDQETLERTRSLRKGGVSTRAELDAAVASAAASSAQVKKLQATLEQKQLKAPFNGTIGIPLVDLGQYLTPGTVVATLQDLDTLRADFTVPQQQLPRLSIGQLVNVTLTERQLTLQGHISGINPKVDQQTRLVAARVEIDNQDNEILPGQFVSISVLLPDEQDVISVPQTALVTSLYGDYVYVVEKQVAANSEAAGGNAAVSENAVASDNATDNNNGEPALALRQAFVTAGRRDEGRVEIVKGLDGGEQVVNAGQNRLGNGMPVTVDNSVVPQAKTADAAEQPESQQ